MSVQDWLPDSSSTPLFGLDRTTTPVARFNLSRESRFKRLRVNLGRNLYTFATWIAGEYLG